MRISRYVVMTSLGAMAGLVGGYFPAVVILGLAAPSAREVAGVVGFAASGAITAIIQRSGGAGIPRWWPLASAAGWAAIGAAASRVPDHENTSLLIAISVAFLFSLIVGGSLVVRGRSASPIDPTPRARPREPKRFGSRVGALAVPSYLLAVGVGHVALALNLSARAQGPQDGQAFSGTFFLGIVFVVLSLFALPLALGLERGIAALLRGAAVGLLIAIVVVGYTASRGIDRGGEVGVKRCIMEFGREICAPGDGTYIKDARPDVLAVLLAALAAYGLAHGLGRAASVRHPVPRGV